ncbi:cation-translocating P-type ATPase [Vulcanococcus sp.]|jgi:Ca2+-transporting ATPase|uniref:cation-translocating P-type ATPase n=1 Tax=Vulcanococcus sp. TaxID=2856995 RepID=UPI0037DA0201
MALLEPTNLLLLACSLIYLGLGEPAEASILWVLVAGISLLDASQKRRSQRALAALARLAAPHVHLLRAGVELSVPQQQVRCGDLLRLEEGDRVAADAHLRRAVGLWLDESLLTGESLPVVRQAGDTIHAGSLVASGRGWAEVVAVADQTELGRIGRSLATLQSPLTPLQRHTRRLTGRLTLVAVALSGGLFLLQGSMTGHWAQALLAALALALAVLPNEIPVVLAMFLALGSLRLARLGVLARCPAAVESLGSTTVLAVDKTGTLTENRMAVQQLLSWPQQRLWRAGESLEEPWHRLVELAVLASRHDPVDAMEVAIQRLAAEHLPVIDQRDHLHPQWPLLREYPLQSDLLVFSQLWCDEQGHQQIAAKGAPEGIADLCHLDGDTSRQWLAAAELLAQGGLRVLAVASGLDGAPLHPELQDQPDAPGGSTPPAAIHDVVFQPLGLVALADPLRPQVPEAIALAQAAGVRVLLISGDGPTTARAIADQAGLPPGPVLCGADLEALSAAALHQQMRQVSVFARVLPQQKLRLVKALQAAGEVVAMGGDGVNDAPALKAADIGVAMGRRGTAVAREAADLVLLNDDFRSLVAAVALGRRIAANLHRALAYTLSIHLPIAALSLMALLMPQQPLLLMPVHIALLHLVIDPACTVVFEALPADPTLMLRPPRPPDAPLFGTDLWRQEWMQGGVVLVQAVVLALWPGLAIASRRSLVMALLVWSAGGLVWLNATGRTALGPLALVISGLLWGVMQGWPALATLLALAPMDGALVPQLLGLAAVLLLAFALAQRRCAAADLATGRSRCPVQ